MTGRVEGKMAFITGAAQGLGEAIAFMLAKEGSKVVLADINEDKLLDVEKLYISTYGLRFGTLLKGKIEDEFSR